MRNIYIVYGKNNTRYQTFGVFEHEYAARERAEQLKMFGVHRPKIISIDLDILVAIYETDFTDDGTETTYNVI